MRWGVKLDGNFMTIISVADFEVDFIKAVALHMEADLESRFNEDDISAEMLSRPHAHEVSWRRRCVSKSTGNKSDDVVTVSSVNALDEPLKAVCVLQGTLAGKATADP